MKFLGHKRLPSNLTYSKKNPFLHLKLFDTFRVLLNKKLKNNQFKLFYFKNNTEQFLCLKSSKWSDLKNINAKMMVVDEKQTRFVLCLKKMELLGHKNIHAFQMTQLVLFIL